VKARWGNGNSVWCVWGVGGGRAGFLVGVFELAPRESTRDENASGLHFYILRAWRAQ
jgi:hypothetical protein